MNSLSTDLKKKLHHTRDFVQVICGNRTIELRATSSGKVREWASAINNVSQKSPDGWCVPHRFGSYAPPRGITDDGSQAQWFVDGKVVFEAIASSIEAAKSKVKKISFKKNSDSLR